MPDFYAARAGAVDNPATAQQAEEFVERVETLTQAIETGRGWEAEFTEPQINAWFIQKLASAADWMPADVVDPRVEIADDELRLGFRWKAARVHGVVTCVLVPRLTAPNELAVEIKNVRFGALPIPESWLRNIEADLQELPNVHVASAPTADGLEFVIRWESGGQHAPVTSLDLAPGRLRLAGKR